MPLPRPRAARRSVLTTAAATAAGLLLTAAPAQAVPFERLQGDDRYRTAVAISSSAFPRATTVVLVSGAGFPDALAAAPLAASLDAPVLLVGRDGVPAEVSAEIARLGATRAVVVGGTSAVSATALTQLPGAVTTVTRVDGANRYDTAARVARTLVPDGAPRPQEVLVASGESFADGLSAGAYAATRGIPLLLTSRGGLSPETATALRSLAPARITIVGGPAAVSGQVATEAAAIGSVRRLEGDDRYATAGVVMDDLWSGEPEALLASGVDFPDALAGAALGRPLLLTRPDCLPQATADAYAAIGTTRVVALGGTRALSDAAARGDVCRAQGALPEPPAQPVVPPPVDLTDDKDCSDFTTGRQAQAYYDELRRRTGVVDRDRLDADGDGRACDALWG